MSLNNLLPLVGAIIPALYQARYSLPSNIAQNVFLTKFTYNLIWSLFVVIITCMTLFVDILNHQIILVWNSSEKCMTVLYYIVVVGIGSVFLANFIFGILFECCNQKKGIWIAYVILNSIILVISAHILFMNFIFTIRN
jgi:hypothetical protein